MAGLDRRLERLETSHPPPCEECVHAPGAPVEGYEVEWADHEDADEREPEKCAGCGQQLVYVVTWGDEAGEGAS